ncbi:unnamed protein product [Scytosiphon promiscuus]
MAMAHRELQGRLQLAEQQVRMYREAMEHLMKAPTASSAIPAPQPRKDVRPLPAADETPAASTGHQGGPRPLIAGGEEACPTAKVPPPPQGGGDGISAGRPEAIDEEESGADRHPSKSGVDGEAGAPSKAVAGISSETAGCGDGGSRESSSSARSMEKGPDIWGLIGGAVGWIGEGTAGWMAQSRAKQEHGKLVEDIKEVRRRRAEVWRERELLARTRAELARCRADLLAQRIFLDARRSDIAEARQNCKSRKVLYSEQLVSAMRMGALNDCFHIWHQGPFGTINGFRVGRLNAHMVDWQEVNAGVGQAAIVLVTVAMAMGVEFSKYLIAPCGSFTKIARSEDGRVLYSLHTDESFSLFPRRNFNFALKAFLHCLGEVGDHVQEHDPTLRLPYHIKEKEGTVGGLPVALGSSYEDWTRALKYMLTDLKWIAAWAAKYLPPC